MTALVVTVVAALALSGCGGDGTGASAPVAPATTTGGAGPAGAMLVDGGLSVAAARAAGPGLIAVRAFVVVADGGTRLCDALQESFPPGCGEPSMPVTGLPDELVAGLAAEEGRRWSDAPVQLLGAVRDGVFVNDPRALAAG